MITKYCRPGIVKLFILLSSIVAVIFLLPSLSQAQKPEPGFSGNDTVVVNGKPCEVLIETLDDGSRVYKRNPDINDEEWNKCKLLIKQRSVEQPYVPDEVLVVFNNLNENNEIDSFKGPKSQAAMAYGVFAAAAGKVEERPGWALVKLNANKLNTLKYRDTVQQAIAALSDDPRVKWIGPNYLAQKLDPPYSWGVDFVQGYDSQIPCDGSIGIAYIDTGIRLDHSEFGPNTYYGWNFVADTPDAVDDEGHGTYVTSLGSGLNVGTCRGSTAVAYKALDNSGWGSYDDIAQAVISATNDSRVDFISMSLGGTSNSPVLESAIAASTKLIFIATGNSLGDSPAYPARYAETYDHVIPVGAIDENARLATFSNRFKGCSTCGVVAPGVNIVGADYLDPNGYIVASGTSASTPFVAGLAASLKSYNTGLTNAQIRNLILNSAVKLGDTREYSNGTINMAAALSQAGMTIELKPIVAWPLPWPGSSVPNVSVQLLTKTPAGTPTSVSTTVESPDGLTQTIAMAYDPSLAHWQAVYNPVMTGVYSFTINSDGRNGFDVNNFYVVEDGATGGWPQFGQQPENGSFLSHKLDISSVVQIYNQWNDISASTSESVVAQQGRAAVPSAVRIVGNCPYGEYGQVFNYDPDIGVYSSYNVLYPSTLKLSCSHGMGMFPESAAFGGNLFIPDEGGSVTNWDGRVHSVNPVSGEQYWLTQIGYHQNGALKLSPDGLVAYSAEGTYAGLQALNALTGERLWYYPGSISAPPALKDDTVYVLIEGSGYQRGLHALEAQTGSFLWEYPTTIWGEAAPLIVGNMVVFCGGNTLYAVDSGSGAYRWSTSLGNQGFCDSTPARIGQSHLVAYMGDSGGNYLHLLDAQTGAALAQVQVVSYGSNASSPAVIGDHVFLTDYDGMISAYHIDLNTPALTKVWNDVVDPYSLSSWQTSGLVGRDAQGLYVLVTASGNNGFLKAWKFRMEESVAITITKMANVETAGVGETITYTYRVTNTGTVNLSDLTAVDTPLGVVPLEQSSLAPGQGTTGILTYTVTEADLPGPLTNTVIATGIFSSEETTAAASISVILHSGITPNEQVYLPLILRSD